MTELKLRHFKNHLSQSQRRCRRPVIRPVGPVRRKPRPLKGGKR